MNINFRKIILIIFLLVLVLLLGIGIYFYFSRTQLQELSHGSCLLDNEVVEYRIEKRKDAPSSADVFIKEKDTNKQIFKFRISNIVPDHYYSYEAHRCGIYMVREFNYDYKREKPLPGFKMEVWRYSYDGVGKKIVEENDFRIDPTESYIVLIKSYLGKPDYALVIKDLKTQEDVFVLKYSDLINKYSAPQGYLRLGRWTDDGKYLWGTLFIGAFDTAYYRIEAGNWQAKVFSPPPDMPSGAERTTSFAGYIAYADFPTFFGIDIIAKQEQERFKQEEKEKHLYVYNLFTKEKELLATVADPAWNFKPNWLSDTELQYELPTGEKKIYRINK